jgi:hypothetical protein
VISDKFIANLQQADTEYAQRVTDELAKIKADPSNKPLHRANKAAKLAQEKGHDAKPY